MASYKSSNTDIATCQLHKSLVKMFTLGLGQTNDDYSVAGQRTVKDWKEY